MPTQNLNVDTSIVDFLKSKGQDSSRGSRATLYEKAGLGSANTYSGTYDQNVALLGYAKKNLGGKDVPSASGNQYGGAQGNGGAVNIPQTGGNVDLHGAINGAQDNEIDTMTGAQVPTRGGENPTIDAYGSISELLKGGLPAKPNQKSFTDTYNTLRGTYGLSNLESQLNDLNAEEETIQASKRMSIAGEKAKPVAMNVIEGRVGEQERNFAERIDTVQRQKEHISNQIKTAYDAIDTVMKYNKLDYDTAKDDYDKQFSQNIQLFNTVQGYVDKQTDNARSNLQIIYNAIQNNGLKLSEIDPAQKALLSKLETQAGFPIGTYNYFQAKNPKAEILYSGARTTGGKKYVDFIYRDEDGQPRTQSMFVGSSTGTGSGDKNAIHFTNEQKQKLIGAGFSTSEIPLIEEDIQLHGLQEVLNGITGTNASRQKTALQALFGSGRSI